MMRSMYSGVSGLRVHQTKMDVIGNNIANVNTVGYKRGQVTFQEVFSQVVRGASAPQEGKGGTNPQQIGLGVNVGSINTVHTKGATQRTDNATDLMIDGEGFFVVSDDANFENRYYTRAGNFTLDRAGNLVTADGFKVLGYKFVDGNWTSEIGGIVINQTDTVPPTTTKNIEMRGNLDPRTAIKVDTSSDTPPIYTLNPDSIHMTDTIIKDSLGNSYKVEYAFVKSFSEEGVTGTAYEYVDGKFKLNGVTDPKKVTSNSNNWEYVITNIQPLKGDSAVNFTPSTTTTSISFAIDGSLATGDKDTILLESIGVGFGNYVETDPAAAEYEGTIEIDLSQLTQYANEADAKPHALDGNTAGNLDGFAIDATGTVIGSFTNGERKALGQIILAKFDNPMGLQKTGNNFFIDTRNSGEPQIGKPSNSGLGAIAPGSLEMSNVDLSLEFTEMITTQRGFQANSRIITTSDEMLQELVNMKR
ncbi:MAG: flagellar hook protein FlgE [Tissierellales bacterium]